MPDFTPVQRRALEWLPADGSPRQCRVPQEFGDLGALERDYPELVETDFDPPQVYGRLTASGIAARVRLTAE